jgi:hypothetical protein
MRHVIWAGLLALGGIGLTGCGGGEEPAAASTDGEGVTAGAEAAAEAWAPFDEMDHETKGRYMAEVVMPVMNEVFAAAPASDRLPTEVSCETCHGDDAMEVGFVMPNTLYPLVPQEIAGMFTSEDEELAAISIYMAGPVEHRMAELLGRQPYDVETGEGFGCLGCHAVAD